MLLEYLGNYSHWIKQEWIDYLMANEGYGLPRDAKYDQAEDGAGLMEACIENKAPDGTLINDGDEAWDPQCVCCISYKEKNLPFNPGLPIDIKCDGFEWFFLKLTPGMVQPIHQDQSVMGRKYVDGIAIPDPNVKRYWMPLQDYARGHLFVYNDELIVNYKKGDLFLHQDETAWHGGGNMGHSTRLTFNFTVWNT